MYLKHIATTNKDNTLVCCTNSWYKNLHYHRIYIWGMPKASWSENHNTVTSAAQITPIHKADAACPSELSGDNTAVS